MNTFGNLGDAFAALREVAEMECTAIGAESVREWAQALAQFLGEEMNLEAAWPEGERDA